MFNTTTDLMPHQVDAVTKLLPSRVNALFAEMGTGKSRIAIELAKLRQSKVDRVVWFCPVSLRATIVAEILKHTDCSEHDIYVVDDAAKASTMPLDRQWYIVGVESIGASTRAVLAVRPLLTERCFALIDESTYIKNSRAKRTMRITHMSMACRYRAVLTGTPFTQGIPDLYSQMYFLSPKILGYRSWYSFAANHIIYDTKRNSLGQLVTIGRILRTHDHEYLAQRMAPYTYQIRKDECLALPEKVFETRYIDMNNEQRSLYEDAKEWIYERHKDDDEPGPAILRLFGVLQTIGNGFWRRPTGDGRTELMTVATQRPGAMLDIIAGLDPPEKVVIWAQYHHCVDEIVAALTAEYGADAVQQFHGRIQPSRRDAELLRWRAAGRFLVATQQTGGHGLTLTESCTAIFYANGFKYSERAQAEDRIHRIGQERKALYVDIVCRNSVDVRVHGSLSVKADALRAFKNQIDLHRKTGLRERLRAIIDAL